MQTDLEYFYATIRRAQWWCAWHLMWGLIGMYYYMDCTYGLNACETRSS